LAKGQSLFEEEQYQKALDIFTSFIDTREEIPPSVLIYAGVSAVELDKNEEAISYFDKLISMHVMDQSKEYWYKALVFLKQNRKEEEVTTLEIITQDKNNFNFKKAGIPLDKLR